jgi:hypothetical protein
MKRLVAILKTFCRRIEKFFFDHMYVPGPYYPFDDEEGQEVLREFEERRQQHTLVQEAKDLIKPPTQSPRKR